MVGDFRLALPAYHSRLPLLSWGLANDHLIHWKILYLKVSFRQHFRTYRLSHFLVPKTSVRFLAAP